MKRTIILRVNSDTKRRRGHRYAEWAFVATVTVMLLALIASQARRGPAALPAITVYSFAAGFEFLSASWRGRRRTRDGRREVQR